MTYKEEFITFMVRSGVLTFGDFTTKSGRKTPYFVNTGNYKTGAQAAKLGDYYAACIQENMPDGITCLFGPAYKGIPLAVSAAASLYRSYDRDLPYCFNRKEAKDHGEGGTMVGYKPQDGDDVAIVEDVVTAGTAVRESIELFKHVADVNMKALFVSVDRMERGTRDCSTLDELRQDYGIKVFPIVTVREVIDFLHNPQKYTAIGARLPKGALLVGSPGTGKTLLAKAVAGEANVPFFSISGSEFVEMFVGVGASRVRDLFKEAAKVAPCIIFIDEIDTIGKSRDGGRFGGGNDEREQTLNQLLAELDGFDPGKGIIVLGATNRPEVLDKALLRPGRFDRRITVDRPNLAGRLATLQVHTRNIHLAEDVNLEKIAQATAGCVGADLANLVNEAALRAVRLGRSAVNQNDLLAAFETVIAGSEKKGTVITDEEKRIIAYHEVGHALVAAKQKNAQPVSKITIVPHTQGALGYTLHLPEEEKFLMSREDILAEIRTLLAGRSSEEVVCHTMTSGANDIERATEMARNLVARFGMCEEFDMMALGSVQNQYLDGTYSMSCAQETYAAADRAVIAIIRQCHEDARRMLEENRELLDKIAAYLLKKETITGQEMMAIIEGRDPETVDNYGATREEKQPLFRPSSPEVIEAPAKHIHIVSEPVPSPEEQTPEEAPPDRDPGENEHK